MGAATGAARERRRSDTGEQGARSAVRSRRSGRRTVRPMTAADVPPRIAEVEAQLVAKGGLCEVVTAEIDGQPIEVFANRTANLRELIVKSVAFGDAEYLMATDGESERHLTFA